MAKKEKNIDIVYDFVTGDDVVNETDDSKEVIEEVLNSSEESKIEAKVEDNKVDNVKTYLSQSNASYTKDVRGRYIYNRRGCKSKKYF